MAPTAPTPKRKPAKRTAKATKQAAPRRPGRPLRIHEQIGERTIGETIIAAVQAGNYVETAAAAAGVNKATLYDYMRRGARLLADEHEGRRSRFTSDERALMGFSDAVATAIATSEARDVTNLARLGQGGIPVVVETVKVNEKGETVERTTRTTHTLPDAGVLEWRLERRFRVQWGRQVEVTGAGGGPLAIEIGASAREALEAELEKVHDRLAAAVPPPVVAPESVAPTDPNP